MADLNRPLAIAVLDSAGVVSWANDDYCLLTGTPQQAIGSYFGTHLALDQAMWHQLTLGSPFIAYAPLDEGRLTAVVTVAPVDLGYLATLHEASNRDLADIFLAELRDGLCGTQVDGTADESALQLTAQIAAYEFAGRRSSPDDSPRAAMGVDAALEPIVSELNTAASHLYAVNSVSTEATALFRQACQACAELVDVVESAALGVEDLRFEVPLLARTGDAMVAVAQRLAESVEALAEAGLTLERTLSQVRLRVLLALHHVDAIAAVVEATGPGSPGERTRAQSALQALERDLAAVQLDGEALTSSLLATSAAVDKANNAMADLRRWMHKFRIIISKFDLSENLADTAAMIDARLNSPDQVWHYMPVSAARCREFWRAESALRAIDGLSGVTEQVSAFCEGQDRVA